MSLVFVAFALLACGEPEKPKETKKVEEKPACDVTIDKMGGTQWVLWRSLLVGVPDKPEPIYRMKFEGDASALKAKYSAGSSGDVYEYSCRIDGNIATCIETDPHLEGFCKAYAAAHDGVCDPAALAQIIGASATDLEPIAKAVNAELKKLKPAQAKVQRQADNRQSNKLRGKFKVAIDPKCQLTLEDKYLTMMDGKLQEFQNVLVPGSKFRKATEDFIFETCRDVESAWAPDDKDAQKSVQPPGTIKFSSTLKKGDKKAGCTYTADVYRDYVKLSSDLATTDDKKWGPRWDTMVPLAEEGKHVVFFDRYRTCGGAKEKLALSCALVRID